MHPTEDDVPELIARARPAKRRRDADTLVSLMRELSGYEPHAWGSIIGFGSCHYVYPTGNAGDMPVLAFAPRASASTIYLTGADRHRDLLDRLGPHTTSVACLYIKDLDLVDLEVLRAILERDLAWTLAGGSEEMRITVNPAP